MDWPGLTSLAEARICAAFGVPAIIAGARIGIENGSQYANYSTARRSFYVETMQPLWTAVGAAFTHQIAVRRERAAPVPRLRHLAARGAPGGPGNPLPARARQLQGRPGHAQRGPRHRRSCAPSPAETCTFRLSQRTRINKYWEIGKLGDWEIWTLGDWEIGRSTNPPVSQSPNLPISQSPNLPLTQEADMDAQGKSFVRDDSFAHSEPPWSEVDKSRLPRECFADQGEPDKKSTWRYPWKWVQDAAGVDARGCCTGGVIRPHKGGIAAAWADANGARSGTQGRGRPPQARRHPQTLRPRLAGQGAGSAGFQPARDAGKLARRGGMPALRQGRRPIGLRPLAGLARPPCGGAGLRCGRGALACAISGIRPHRRNRSQPARLGGGLRARRFPSRLRLRRPAEAAVRAPPRSGSDGPG